MFVCRPGFGEFFRHYKLADEVIELNKKDSRSVADFRARLKAQPIQYLLVLHQSARTAAVLRGLDAEKRVSYKQWWNAPFFDTRVERPMQWPEPLRALALLAPLSAEWADRLGRMEQHKQQDNSAERHLLRHWPHKLPDDLSVVVEPDPVLVSHVLKGKSRPYIAVAPSSVWATKRWTESGFARLMELAAERGLSVYLVGAENEKQVCHNIVQLMKMTGARVDVRSVAGEFNLMELHAFLSHAEVVVANDSGPMHMATVAGRPVVGIFGPTVLEQGYRPWSNHSMIAQVDLSCRPCGAHGHEKCPLGHHNCMKNVSAEMVMVLVEQLRKNWPR